MTESEFKEKDIIVTCVFSLDLKLPIEDLCSLSSRSLQSFTATVPASTEDVLLKGFQMLEMENDRIETAQQVCGAKVNNCAMVH